MVQQLCLENRRLEDKLVERKIEVEELRDNLRLLHRGLSAKLKCLNEATGHKDLYLELPPKKVIIIILVRALVFSISFRFSLV